MPEQISKYPEVTLQVLKGAGARCGPGVEKKILTKCPSERFCSLPTGEICVYGIEQVPQMTQITTQDLARVVCPPAQRSSSGFEFLAGSEATVLGVSLVAGFVAGGVWRKFRGR